jgi:hypothetical protein
MKVIPGMCRAKLDNYVFVDFPLFIPWTHQMKVVPGMCRAKLDSYVFIDFPVFLPWMHQMKVIPGMCRTKLDICLYWLSSIYSMDAPDEGYSKDVLC